VGPDLLFWAPDYEVVDKVYRLHKNIQEIVDLYNEVVQPIRDIRDAVVDPVEDLVESLAPATVSLIRQAIEEMKETAALFKSTLATGLFSGVIGGFNFLTDLADLPRLSGLFFDQFRPPLQNNDGEDQWYWFDMLHYRNTGDFARSLVDGARASGDPAATAFAHGYLSHIATDLTGHAFVNQIVGAPYRLRPQRHVTVENFMDCWKFDEYYGQSVNQTLVDRLGVPATLPTAVGDLIFSSFPATYEGLPHPTRLAGGGYLSREQIDQTYEIFYEVLQIMKNMAVERPEEPFSGVADVLEAALADLFEAPPTPPDTTTSACSLGDIFSFGLTDSSRDCYEEFFENVAEWFEYLAELFVWAIETMLDLIDLLLAALLSLPIVVLLAILYGLQLLLYEIYQTMRHTLALEGFLFPEPDYLHDAHGRNLTTTFQCDITPFAFPRWFDLTKSHLTCAPADLERPTTASDFNAAADSVTANTFIKDRPLNLRNLQVYANSESPAQTRSIERDRLVIGNATDLTALMVGIASADEPTNGQESLVFTNWNLDADRGYGYKTWQGDIPSQGGESVESEAYV
jgi:hypothetical protein